MHHGLLGAAGRGCALRWKLRNGCGSKLNSRAYAGFGPCFHLPGFHFVTGLLNVEPQPSRDAPGRDLIA